MLNSPTTDHPSHSLVCRRTAVLIAALFAISSQARAKANPQPGAPGEGPYSLTLTGPTTESTLGTITHTQGIGTVISVLDPANYFGNIPVGTAFTLTTDINFFFLTGQPEYSGQYGDLRHQRREPLYLRLRLLLRPDRRLSRVDARHRHLRV